MTLKKRIVVTILTDGKGNAVKPVAFSNHQRVVGSLMQTVRVQETRNIDELILIDINASKEGRTINFDAISEFTSELYCPLTLGGGIYRLEHIRSALNAGADKVIVKTALSYVGFIRNAANKYGAQCIVGAVDVWNRGKDLDLGQLNGLITRVKVYTKLGVGEICLTSMTHDGTLGGYDLELLGIVRNVSNTPLIINGGCGTPWHMADAFQAGADACAASSMFLYNDVTPKSCARELKRMGYNVRIESTAAPWTARKAT